MLVLFLSLLVVVVDGNGQDPPATPAEQLKALVEDHGVK